MSGNLLRRYAIKSSTFFLFAMSFAMRAPSYSSIFGHVLKSENLLFQESDGSSCNGIGSFDDIINQALFFIDFESTHFLSTDISCSMIRALSFPIFTFHFDSPGFHISLYSTISCVPSNVEKFEFMLSCESQSKQFSTQNMDFIRFISNHFHAPPAPLNITAGSRQSSIWVYLNAIALKSHSKSF